MESLNAPIAILLMPSLDTTKLLLLEKRGEPYNIGIDSPEISVFELATKVKTEANDLFDYNQEVIVSQTHDDKEYLTDNPQRRCPNIDKAKSELNYNPQVSPGDGIRSFLRWSSVIKDIGL